MADAAIMIVRVMPTAKAVPVAAQAATAEVLPTLRKRGSMAVSLLPSLGMLFCLLEKRI